MVPRSLVGVVAAVALVAAACGPSSRGEGSLRAPAADRGRARRGTVVVAAGDIACGGSPCDSHRRTARLIGRIDPDAVLTLGDNQYPDGEYRDFLASYDPTWGRFLRITRPTPGNHDYHVPGAAGYYRYFGRRAHRSRGGYYSFDLGRWHFLALNSGRGGISREQLAWVRRNLERDDHRCELAYWHHPRWSSGTVHGSNTAYGPLWEVLYRKGVDVVLNGHEHNYERFAPMDPRGRRDRRGIRQFVVGTGGISHYPTGRPLEGSQVRIDDRFGVLRLRVSAGRYRWAFVAVGGRVLDRGRDRCHR
ncbi:MAG TPA: metallophosphoesterase [Actinomycetota bacterium]|nr:metallophosphoesterase [Actinomycetota bacterium]